MVPEHPEPEQICADRTRTSLRFSEAIRGRNYANGS